MLFDESIPNDKYQEYYAFRDNIELRTYRDFIELLWCIYEQYAEPKFELKFKEDFKARFWEMYLTVFFRLNHFTIIKQKRIEGPDIQINFDNQIIHVEAVTPDLGNNDIIIPSGVKGSSTNISDQIVLRFTSSLSTKFKIISKYISKGLISSLDPVIIALNSSKIELAKNGGQPEYILQALFGMSSISFIEYDLQNQMKLAHKYPIRPNIVKPNKSLVNLNFFTSKDYEYISGILYSSSTPFLTNIGSDFVFIPNPFAKNKLPKNWLIEIKVASKSTTKIIIKPGNSVG